MQSVQGVVQAAMFPQSDAAVAISRPQQSGRHQLSRKQGRGTTFSGLRFCV